MIKQSQASTFIVQVTSKSTHGCNQDYYYRNEVAAYKQAGELKKWFKNTGEHIAILVLK